LSNISRIEVEDAASESSGDQKNNILFQVLAIIQEE
jgi:hypothetical protein